MMDAQGVYRYMPVEEFTNKGYLQELNRRFLHPLGLALEVVRVDDSWQLGGIQDCREDPEGMMFDPEVLNADARSKAQFVLDELLSRKEAREKLFHGPIQPIGDEDA